MGKTTLIHHLTDLGYASFPESGRAIIRQQQATGGQALPWQDREAFARLMFRQTLIDRKEAMDKQGLVFFDRGLPDVIGYLEFCGLPIPPEMEAAARDYRYHRLVALTPPWPGIYTKDPERRQTFEEAVATYHMIQQVYIRYGYEPVVVPKGDVRHRAAFVIACMSR